jgi:hypothetical protein
VTERAHRRGVRLTLYGRTYCHLCEDMLAALQPLAAQLGFTVDVVDVDSDPALEARFGEWVPVLVHGDTEICHYRLDAARLTAHLGSFR